MTTKETRVWLVLNDGEVLGVVFDEPGVQEKLERLADADIEGPLAVESVDEMIESWNR